LLDTYQGHYFDMLHAFNMMQGVGKIGDLVGESAEYVLRKAGVNRATARNIHRAINDGATVFGIGGAVKGAAKFGARTASKAGKGTTRISLDGLGLEKPKVDKWVRTPSSLQDQMALRAAEAGEGKVLNIELRDPRYKNMLKKRVEVTSDLGKKSVVHYVLDPTTGLKYDFKFKQRSTDPVNTRRK